MRAATPRLTLLALGLAACQADGRIYQSPDGAGDDDAAVDGDAEDAPVDGPTLSLQYLPASEAYPGTTSWTVSANTALSTTTLAASPALPAGVTFASTAQLDASATEVAVLRVDAVTIADGVTLTVTGSRPLVIMAGRDVEVAGLIEAGARLGAPGPNGQPNRSGYGGAQSGHAAGVSDTGGGGAGHATDGARGGSCNGSVGGTQGAAHAEAPPRILHGGSGGGDGSTRTGSPCFTPLGGGGGGAIFVVSWTQISVTGGINAGGAGGQGGLGANLGACAGDGSSGGGGGSGGQIALQAPAIVGDGAGVALAANGGGGGAGGAYSGGGTGANGSLSTNATTGGTVAEPGTGASAGGVGGALGNQPTSPAAATTGAGGGGGAAGRITVWHGGTIQPLITSPAATYIEM